MKTVAVYSMKGGVGKTTAAVNLAYLFAERGLRTLLWDLDPQAASTFALRIRPRVAGFGKRSLERGGDTLCAAIKETDYINFDLLPADFAYRKLERFLDDLGRPARVVTGLLQTIGRDYDIVILDCPAGFSRLSEGIFGVADLILVPTIPTVLSLRMVAQLAKWGQRTGSPATLAGFFSMVDRRKALHRRVCEWAGHSPLFLPAVVPYASAVEQMTVRRMPVATYAPREEAGAAFETLRTHIESLLTQGSGPAEQRNERWQAMAQHIEALVRRVGYGVDERAHGVAPPDSSDPNVDESDEVAHRFDTAHRSLERQGHVLELLESRLRLVVAVSALDDDGRRSRRLRAQIDRTWALQILAGEMSPLEALEGRLGSSELTERLRLALGNEPLRRIDSRVDDCLPAGSPAAIPPDLLTAIASSI